MDPKFVHLRLHTEYSLSDGLIAIPSLMERATALNMPAIAITDHSNLFATVKFYQAALQAGIKPIIGADVWVIDDKKSKENKPPFRLTFLAKHLNGYKNLLELISRSYLEGQNQGKPLIKKSLLETSLRHGLIVLSGGYEGDIGQHILTHDEHALANAMQYWQTLFPDHYYLEISRVGKKHEAAYIENIIHLADTYQVPVVATNDVRFLAATDFDAHEARVCIHEGTILNHPQRPRHYTDQQYLRSQQEMQTLFADLPEALANTIEIGKRCNVELTLGQNRLPHFVVSPDTTPEAYLCDIAKKGLTKRLHKLFATDSASFADQCQPYELRLEKELAVINKMGFAGYFLIVADFTQWAKENGIPVGPGRGSGPGSLVAYALNITDLDPIALDLLFERFLNPERVSMPDFDIDFCIEGRDRVIDYVIEKNGRDSVAQIITYGTMAAKAVVRDVGRVQGLNYGFVDKIAKLIPFELGITLDKALEQEPVLKERYEQEEDVRTLIDLALKLEGITRNVGKHAGGIVIAPGKLIDFTALYCESGQEAHPVTQFDKDDVEAVGLVKFDFLGLKTLTIIDRALHIINQDQLNKNAATIDINLIPLNDTKTFDLLKACKTTAVFQIESHGMRDLTKRLQPDCFEDIMALVALFRPGPLQSGMVDDFINRKHGRAKVAYPHPKLEPILRPTYGVIIYQEQVMQIAQVLAGYTLGSADILRRAMGKKKPEEMAKQREIFCQGAVTRGVNAELATHIFDLMEKFAGYGFNKSHSASYALIAYQTAWLKVHHPAAFMAAVLSSDMDRTDKIIILMKECQAMGLQVAPPDLNQSEYYFKVVDHNHLLFGLGAIKGVGQAAIENIMEARQQQGPFKDLFDFYQRIDLHKINRRTIEALIKAGAFDRIGPHRASMSASLDHAIHQAEQMRHNATYGQQDLLGLQTEAQSFHYTDVAIWSEEIILQGEKETLGFYLSGHPIHQHLHELTHFTTCRLSEVHPSFHPTATVAGIISQIRTRQTKRGDRIAIFTLDDGTSHIEVVCFAEAYQKNRELITEGQLVIVSGEVGIDEFNNSYRISCRDMFSIEQARDKFVKYLKIHAKKLAELDVEKLQSTLLSFQGGSCPIVLTYLHNNAKANITFGKKWLVKPHSELLHHLREQFTIAEIDFVY